MGAPASNRVRELRVARELWLSLVLATIAGCEGSTSTPGAADLRARGAEPPERELVVFAATSLRQVTSRADVNIAAVNYHFGSKDNLVNEVFRRRMDDMSAERLKALRLAVDSHPGELEPILAAFVEPALAMAQDRHGGGAFIRVIARAYAEKNDGLRRFL